MYTGYDNYWMCNSYTTGPNLLGNGNLSDCSSPKTHIQDGRQTSHSNDFLCAQKDLNQEMTSQNVLNYPQKASQYDWTSRAAQSSNSYNYQNMGVRIQQKDSRSYWQNHGPQYPDSRNSFAQSMNYNNMRQKTQLLEDQYNRSMAQVGRIRVRDVYSLNSIARSSMPSYCSLERQFDNYVNCGYNINQRQQNPHQKNNVEHAQFAPPEVEMNSFPPLSQNTPAPPKPPMTQDWFSNAYPKPRERTSPGEQYHLKNMRRNESSYRNSCTFLQKLLGAVNQTDSRRPEASQNIQTMNSRLNVPSPNTNKDSNLTLSHLMEDIYSSGQTSYRNPPPYTEKSQKGKVIPVSQENAFEPISPPPVEKRSINSEDSSIRVTAVISLPEWCNGPASNKVSVPCNGDCNLTAVTESIKENENSEIPNNDIPGIVSNDPPNGCLMVKEELTLPSEFLPHSTTEIVIQTMKTEDFDEQDESASQNSKRIPNKTTNGAPAVTNNNCSSSNDINNYNNNEDKNQNSDKYEIDLPDETPTEKINVESKDSLSKESPNTSDVRSGLIESNYKSKINRDKLDMLIEFLNGSDNRTDYVSEQSYSEKFKKQKKVDCSILEKLEKFSSEKSKISVTGSLSLSKLAKVESNLQDAMSDDSGKKAQIKSEKKEHNPASPGLKNQPKEIDNVGKAKPKSDTKKTDLTDCALGDPKETQENCLGKSPERNKNDSKRSRFLKKEKIDPNDQSQITVTKKKTESAEKISNSEITKIDTDVAKSEKYSDAKKFFHVNQEKVRNLPTSDVNQDRKPKINHATEVEKTETKVISDPILSIKKEIEELQKKMDLAQKNVKREGKPKGTQIFPNLKYQFCENCVAVTPTECFWMNVISGEIKCSNCFKRTSVDSVGKNHKLFGDDENLETKTKKVGGKGEIQSPDRKNLSCSDSENQADQKAASNNSSESSYDKKSERRHSTGREESKREKRKSLDENLLDERKKKRWNSEEKHVKKEQGEISETPTPKMPGVSECSKTDKLTEMSLSVFDRSQSPKDEEDSSPKIVPKTVSVSEAAKKRLNSAKDFWPRKGQVVEGEEKNNSTQKSMGILEALKQWEKRKTKNSGSPVGAEKRHGDYYRKPNLKKFSWGIKLLKENHFRKVRSPSEGPQARQEKNDKRKNEKEATRSAKEHMERVKQTINGPLEYKEFILKKSLAFCFSDTIKRDRFTDILEEVDSAKRNRKCNGER